MSMHACMTMRMMMTFTTISKTILSILCLHLIFQSTKGLAVPPTTALTSPKAEYDLLVIGGGSAGLTAAKFAATFGKVR